MARGDVTKERMRKRFGNDVVKIEEYLEGRREYARAYRAKKKAEDPAFGTKTYGKFPSTTREALRAYHHKKNYGITLEQYGALVAAQDGKCAICSDVLPLGGKAGPCVDHCHETGEIRGILCAGCNKGIGMLKDNPRMLRLAAAYLERYARVTAARSHTA